MEVKHKISVLADTPLPETRNQHIVGNLVYLIIIRPKITNPVQVVNQFVSTPKSIH